MNEATRSLTGLILGAALLVGATYGDVAGKGYAKGVVAADGSIRVPDDFRTDYVMLGAGSVSGDGDTGGNIGLHVVYAPKWAVETYRKTGQFADGTVLVKELFKGTTEHLTTGRATGAAAEAGYFVMVKDDMGRYPESPLWGDGWGWSFFTADNKEATTTKDYKSECLGCHIPARSTDLVYVEGYPVLNQ
jgi:hypothetical protein